MEFAHPPGGPPSLPLLELVIPPAPEVLDDVLMSEPPLPASLVLPAALDAVSEPPAPPCPSAGSGISMLAEKTQAAADRGRDNAAMPSRRVRLIAEAYQSASFPWAAGGHRRARPGEAVHGVALGIDPFLASQVSHPRESWSSYRYFTERLRHFSKAARAMARWGSLALSSSA